MKTAALVLVSLLLLVAPAVSQTTDDKLIVPGVRAGKWTLKMTLDELEKANGPATLFGGPFNTDFRGHQIFSYYWASLDFAVNGYEPRKVEWISVGWYGGYGQWRTEKGIGLFQSTRADILKAYGKPTVETVPVQGQKNIIYDAIGIAFQVYDGGKTREIRVFPPGTAKNIWKF